MGVQIILQVELPRACNFYVHILGALSTSRETYVWTLFTWFIFMGISQNQ